MSNKHESEASTAAPAAVHPLDLAALQEALKGINDTYGVLDKNLTVLKEQTASLVTADPAPGLVDQFASLGNRLTTYDKTQQARVTDIKKMIKSDIKVEVAEALSDQIRAQIRAEIASEVKVQMELQMSKHLPVPLATQAEESRTQILAVKQALQNSEARRKNSALRPSPSNLGDMLAVVLRPGGTKSAVYPADLRSLFAYDHVKVKALLKDFELYDYGVLEKNLNRFLAHIGIRFELVPLPPISATSPHTEATLVPLSS